MAPEELVKKLASEVFEQVAPEWGKKFPENKYREVFELSENSHEP